jgi:beta-N-acetylhexosaminidase
MKKSFAITFYVFSLFAMSLLNSSNAPLFLRSQRAQAWAKKTIETMSLEKKIGQLIMIPAVVDEQMNTEFMQKKPYYQMDRDSVTKYIKTYHVGGIIWLGASVPKMQQERTQEYQNHSSIILLIGQDLEPGRIFNTRFPTLPPVPSAYELAKTQDTDRIYNTGIKIGALCNKCGVHINFAPVADIHTNEKNTVIGDRAFGRTPKEAGQGAYFFMRGLHQAGILSCAKHFPGHGDTHLDSHYHLPVIDHSKERLKHTELRPFKKLIDAGVSSVMIGHLAVPALEPEKNLPATLSKVIITDLLKKKYGFKGLVITDALHMESIKQHGSSADIAVKALSAGVDILLAPAEIPAVIEGIKQAVAQQIITQPMIDEKVYKILAAKGWIICCQELF